MSTRSTQNRPISAQRLPVSLSAPRPHPFSGAARPAAAFLAHLLSGKPNIAQPRGNVADSVYRQTEISDIKRLPPGYRKNLSA